MSDQSGDASTPDAVDVCRCTNKERAEQATLVEHYAIVHPLTNLPGWCSRCYEPHPSCIPAPTPPIAAPAEDRDVASTPEGRAARLLERPCREGNCVELYDPETGESDGGWGPVGCPCQDEPATRRRTPMTNRDDATGLEARYEVRKINDPTGKHNECRYFVLDPQHDPTARGALNLYAARTPHDRLRRDLRDWLDGLAPAEQDDDWEGDVLACGHTERMERDRHRRCPVIENRGDGQ